LFAITERMAFHAMATTFAKGTRSGGGTTAKLRSWGSVHT
jgi:hypothetical protein